MEENKAQAIEEIAKVIEKTEQIARDAHCGLPSPTMYAKALYWKGYRMVPDDIGEFSDGDHTFNELYHHRAVLFSVICNMFPEKAWKSKLHDTGDMFDGMFIVAIETEQGQATYHYDIEPYWDMIKVKELEKAPKWDGHSPADAIERIGNISFEGYRKQREGVWIWTEDDKDGYEEYWICTECNERDYFGSKFCPNCGAKMKGGAE
jgi:hypothetical protein